MAIGRSLGGGAASLIRAITGMGDYKVTANSLVPGALGYEEKQDSLPAFGVIGRGTRIQHREFIQDIVSSSVASAFSVTKFAIQPAFTFPWLSTVASNYQEYKINGMVFEFKSTSSDALNSTNTALGSVVMSTQYNVLQPDPLNKASMEQLEFVTSCKPSLSMLHPLECARGESMMTVLSTRSGPAATGSDLRLYDYANHYVSVSGMQATNVNIGELWVSYDITLLKPRLGSAADMADRYYVAGTGVDTTHYFGSPRATASTSSDLGTVLTDTTITFPANFTGNVLVDYWCQGNSTAGVTAPTVTGSAGCTALTGLLAPAVSSIGNNGNTWGQLTNRSTWSCVGGGVITFSGGTFPAALTAMNLLIVVLPSSLTN